ncbi:GNAT family N-acetyltransferase [Dactylosporangium vinaceum]|nr:GNAT family N-acetyltransferase [Dactylosporangium vinaceum]
MMPQLAALAADPSPLTGHVSAGDTTFTVRALLPSDAGPLTSFLANLSATSRRYWHGDTAAADESARLIEAIGRYDKLRLVAHRPEHPTELAGLIDLSFSLPDGYEITRFAAHGVALDPERTVRFGPCVSDAWQGRGLAAALLPPAWSAARLLSRDCVVLYGGVDPANHRARRFYARHGFTEVGRENGVVDMMRYLPVTSPT